MNGIPLEARGRAWLATPIGPRNRLLALALVLLAILGTGLGSSATAADREQAAALVEQTLQRTAPIDIDLRCPNTVPSQALKLTEAVHRALCHDPRTRASWAAVRVQQAELLLRRSARRPTASASLERGRGHTRESLGDGTVQRDSGPTGSTALQAQWVLWDFGLQNSRETAAEQALLAAAASHDQTIQQTLLTVLQAFLSVAEAQGQLQLNRESERFTRDLLAEARRPHKSGSGSLDMLGEKQARTSLWSKVLDLRRSEGQLARARGELAMLLGLPVQTPLSVELPGSAAQSSSLDASLMPMVDAAMQSYPPLREALARQATAQAELEEARRSDLPVLVASASQQHSRTPTSPGLTDRSVGLRVEIPLSAWGDRQYRVQRAQAQLEAAQQTVRQTRKDVETEVWLSYQNLRENVVALRLAERFRLSAEDLLQAELRSFRAGDSDMFDVLDANSSRTEAAAAELSSLSALNLARARLAASVGQLARLKPPFPLLD